MSWHAKKYGPYSYTSEEARENAIEVFNAFKAMGWSTEAIAAFLGNVGAESEYNPWRWEEQFGVPTVEASHDYPGGYGLVQFTPARKYLDDYRAQRIRAYSPNYDDKTGRPVDAYAQLIFVNNYADYIPTEEFPISYDDFKHATEEGGYTVDWLTRAWFANYERGTWLDTRLVHARYWFTLLAGREPKPPDTGSLPLWILFKLKENSNNG